MGRNSYKITRGNYHDTNRVFACHRCKHDRIGHLVLSYHQQIVADRPVKPWPTPDSWRSIYGHGFTRARDGQYFSSNILAEGIVRASHRRLYTPIGRNCLRMGVWVANRSTEAITELVEGFAGWSLGDLSTPKSPRYCKIGSRKALQIVCLSMTKTDKQLIT